MLSIKKLSGFILVCVTTLNAATAAGFGRADKFDFVDMQGDLVAKVICRKLSFTDDQKLLGLQAQRNEDIVVSSITLKSNEIVITTESDINNQMDSVSYTLNMEDNWCELTNE